ncbi:hypothetical protein LINPERHAP1_LOCUS33022 [Linum perenne]
MMFCGSKAKVDRILAVNRRLFYGMIIALDKWIPEAGCSAVLAKEKVTWITVSGIPIHLRSSDLFRQLGNSCGDFLGFETCSSLSSVRIKIRQARKLPEAIPLKYDSVSYLVRVIPDTVFPDFGCASPVVHSRAIGKTAFRPISPSCFGATDCFEFGSSSSSHLKSLVVSSPPICLPSPMNLPSPIGRCPSSSSKEMSVRQIRHQTS